MGHFPQEIVTSQPKAQNRNPMRAVLRRYPLTLCCIVLIWLLCFCKPPKTELDSVQGIDKLAHVLMYFGTCLVMWWEYCPLHTRLRTTHALAWLVLLPVGMSALIELLQEYATSHRGGDWLDLAANTSGVLLGALVGRYILWPLRKKKES